MMLVDPLLRVRHCDAWNEHFEAHLVGVDGPSYAVAQDAAKGLASTVLQFGTSLSAAYDGGASSAGACVAATTHSRGATAALVNTVIVTDEDKLDVITGREG